MTQLTSEQIEINRKTRRAETIVSDYARAFGEQDKKAHLDLINSAYVGSTRSWAKDTAEELVEVWRREETEGNPKRYNQIKAEIAWALEYLMDQYIAEQTE